MLSNFERAGCCSFSILKKAIKCLFLKLGIKMHKLGEKCDLIQEGGRITDPTIDKRMDFHFNAILDVVSEWRKDKTQHQDVPLGGK